ncbi:hypothetical protein OF117_13700 [Geodermatophilus sp. YIM 151500]|uniref:hypothetical protein n=1 Tax=Geodermatophilus sp. YIM 151500 TaxID=2984531 RepID=UPI0021E35A11|nr:hypothetical protein [Geodermatophilus sp. YIM 151500]MCV2490418.1 hypothetical protein [Geodermatophilus sp. YIM 151500]
MREGDRFVEPGASWRPVRVLALALAFFAVVEVLPVGPVVMPGQAWAVAGGILAVLAAHTLAARRSWTVRVDRDGPEPALTVGRERVPLADVDAGHLRAAAEGRAGVDAGSPVLGGSAALPRGRAGLPVRLAGGRTVLVPTRNPARLRAALLTAVPAGGGVSDATDGGAAAGGTLGS